MDIKIVKGEDWQALYINNVLRLQGHSISIKDMLHALKIDYKVYVIDQEWLEKNGYCPNLLEEIPSEFLNNN